jgi:hypothetical protein
VILLHSLKRFLIYFSYTVFFIYSFSLGLFWERKLQMLAGWTYDPYPHAIFMVAFPVTLGVLLGAPLFISRLKETGRWYFDWVMFLAAGIPALFVNLLFVLSFFTPVGRYLRIFKAVLMAPAPQLTCGILFGILVLASFKKRDAGLKPRA